MITARHLREFLSRTWTGPAHLALLLSIMTTMVGSIWLRLGKQEKETGDLTKSAYSAILVRMDGKTSQQRLDSTRLSSKIHARSSPGITTTTARPTCS